MVTSLSDLVEMMERGTIPYWLRDAIVARKDEIAAAISEGREISLEGPQGERISINSEGPQHAAAL